MCYFVLRFSTKVLFNSGRLKFKKAQFIFFTGFSKSVEILIEKVANINATNNDGESALFLAAERGTVSLGTSIKFHNCES